VSVLQRYPQAKENVPVVTNELTVPVLQEVERLNEELQGTGRVLVRPSGTEPVVRVLAEAETRREADDLCDTMGVLVRRELG
jgi:phosphoglucosamine mutase